MVTYVMIEYFGGKRTQHPSLLSVTPSLPLPPSKERYSQTSGLSVLISILSLDIYNYFFIFIYFLGFISFIPCIICGSRLILCFIIGAPLSTHFFIRPTGLALFWPFCHKLLFIMNFLVYYYLSFGIILVQNFKNG